MEGERQEGEGRRKREMSMVMKNWKGKERRLRDVELIGKMYIRSCNEGFVFLVIEIWWEEKKRERESMWYESRIIVWKIKRWSCFVCQLLGYRCRRGDEESGGEFRLSFADCMQVRTNDEWVLLLQTIRVILDQYTSVYCLRTRKYKVGEWIVLLPHN